MHHLRSGAQNQQPTGAFGSLMTLIMARNTFPPPPPRGRGAASLVGSEKAGWEPAPQRPPHWVGKGLGGVGKSRGQDLGRGRGEAWLEGWKGRRDPGGGRRLLSSEPCLWLHGFDLLPGKPGRSSQAAAKPWSQESVEPAGLHHPPSPHTHLPSHPRK